VSLTISFLLPNVPIVKAQPKLIDAKLLVSLDKYVGPLVWLVAV